MAVSGVRHSGFVQRVTQLLAPGKSPTLLAKLLQSPRGSRYFSERVRQAQPLYWEIRTDNTWNIKKRYPKRYPKRYSDELPLVLAASDELPLVLAALVRRPSFYQQLIRFHGQVMRGEFRASAGDATSLAAIFFGHPKDVRRVLPKYLRALGARMLVDIQLAERREFASRERAFENAASSLDQTLFQVVTRAEALRWSQANTDVLADVTAIERSAGLRAGHHILALPPTIRTLRARGMCDIPDFYRRFLQAYTDTVHGFAIVAGLVEALKDSPSLLVALELAMDMAWESGLSPQDNYFDDLVDAVRRMELAGGDGTELRAIKAMPDIAWSKIGMIRQLHADQALEGHSSRATGLFVDWGMAVWDHVHWGVPLPVVTV